MLLALLFLSYGLLLPWLGYGFDEWHFVYYSTRGVPGLVEAFHYDGHPQAVWSYIQSFRLLGYTPLYWHIYSLFWRWLAVVSFWLCLERLWPANRRQNFVAAALFAVHPVFILQVFPITFFEIWFGYTLLFLSFFFTILAIQSTERQWAFMSIAIALAVGHMFTKEYAWFVELMRPVLIWLALPTRDAIRKKTFQVTKTWLPFFAIFLSYLIWRVFFYTPLRVFFRIQNDIFTHPVQTLLGWIANWFPDAAMVLFTAWYKTFNPEYVYLIRPFNIIALILIVFIVVFFGVYIRKLDTPSQGDDTKWVTQATFLGLPSLLFGVLPFYIASYSIHLTETPLYSRFTIGMLPGVALITAAILEAVISRQTLRIWITVVVLGLSVGWHVRYANDYRKVSAYQADFLQQLTWRVPAMEKNTALFVWEASMPALKDQDWGIGILYGDFAWSMAINSIYNPNPIPTSDQLPYWYYPLYGDQVEVGSGTLLRREDATTVFDGNTSDSLFIYYDPENNRCLHLISAEDQYYKQYPAVIRQMAAQATTDRIESTLNQNVKLRDEILGSNKHSWCYYYQQADLARQFGQWDAIPALWQQAMADKVNTEFGTEYIPFIDGFAHTGNWQKAGELTNTARKLSRGMNSILCPLWSDIEQSTTASIERDQTIQDVKKSLTCESQ